jgi:N-acetyl-gamma-glutamyl-phosphate reductase
MFIQLALPEVPVQDRAYRPPHISVGEENNIQAYKTLTHQHLGEIGESLKQLQPTGDIAVNFVPWRGDFTRGIFISSQLSCDLSLIELNKLYEDFYSGHPFTHVTKDPCLFKTGCEH